MIHLGAYPEGTKRYSQVEWTVYSTCIGQVDEVSEEICQELFKENFKVKFITNMFFLLRPECTNIWSEFDGEML